MDRILPEYSRAMAGGMVKGNNEDNSHDPEEDDHAEGDEKEEEEEEGCHREVHHTGMLLIEGDCHKLVEPAGHDEGGSPNARVLRGDQIF